MNGAAGQHLSLFSVRVLDVYMRGVPFSFAVGRVLLKGTDPCRVGAVKY